MTPSKPQIQQINACANRSGMDLFARSIPAYPWCSSDKTAGKRKERSDALCLPYIQPNPKNLKGWLVFDLDHPNASIWHDVGLPAPNLIVRNRVSGNSHLYYAIHPVTTSANGRDKPKKLMDHVYLGMKRLLKSDPAYHGGPIAKTPDHPLWQTTDLHGNRYELNELLEYLPGEKVIQFRKKSLDVDEDDSRHITLFNRIRRFAYDNVCAAKASGINRNQFFSHLIAFGESVNDFTNPLGYSSIKATANSVSKWTWDYYTGKGLPSVDRGVMKLDPSLSLEYRQRLSSMRTSFIRRTATERKIDIACDNLGKQGTLESASRSLIARAVGISRQAIQRYKDVINSAKLKYAKSVLSRYQLLIDKATSRAKSITKNKSGKSVNLGVHQVITQVKAFTFIPEDSLIPKALEDKLMLKAPEDKLMPKAPEDMLMPRAIDRKVKAQSENTILSFN